MKRKWLLALLFVYLIVVFGVVILVSPLNNRVILTMPESDAILLVGVIIGGVAVVAIEMSSLGKDRRRLFIETRRLDGVIQEQQEFRRALNHELNNPITAVKTGLERLSDNCDHGAVERLKTDVERVSGLLYTVSELTRLETDLIEFGPVNPGEVMRQAVDTIRDAPAAADCKFEVDLPTGPFPLPTVQGNDDLLFIALQNLLSNAVKFAPQNGVVVCRAFEDNDMVVLQVSDNGMGICKEDLDNVWKPFFRGQEAKDRKIPGSGLGLYQVYKIVARHGGQVSIRSKVGEGTEVTIRLPVGNMTN